MDLGLQIAASGMVAEQARQDQLVNNLANASTPGYKPDETPQHNFGSILLANTEGGESVGAVDQGVATGQAYTNLTQGSITETGEPLDFAINGSGFFAVKTASGVRYTRDGQFAANAQGILTDTAGDPVLSQAGTPVTVGSKGTVEASALGVFELSEATKQGENLFDGKVSGTPTGTVRSGALEGSGVDAAKAMVEMITGLRTFQSGQQAIQTIAQTLQEASTEVGSLNVS
jgi:flagellar basal-body rod protein FlgF